MKCYFYKYINFYKIVMVTVRWRDMWKKIGRKLLSPRTVVMLEK